MKRLTMVFLAVAISGCASTQQHVNPGPVVYLPQSRDQANSPFFSAPIVDIAATRAAQEKYKADMEE